MMHRIASTAEPCANGESGKGGPLSGGCVPLQATSGTSITRQSPPALRQEAVPDAAANNASPTRSRPAFLGRPAKAPIPTWSSNARRRHDSRRATTRTQKTGRRAWTDLEQQAPTVARPSNDPLCVLHQQASGPLRNYEKQTPSHWNYRRPKPTRRGPCQAESNHHRLEPQTSSNTSPHKPSSARRNNGMASESLLVACQLHILHAVPLGIDLLFLLRLRAGHYFCVARSRRGIQVVCHGTWSCPGDLLLLRKARASPVTGGCMQHAQFGLTRGLASVTLNGGATCIPNIVSGACT